METCYNEYNSWQRFFKGLTMQKGIPILFVALLLVVRVFVCFYLDDGKVEADEKNYLNMIVNFVDHGSPSIVGISLPDDGPVDPKQYIYRIRESNGPHDFFVDYQWLGALVYIPVVFLSSTKVVVLINNLMYFLSGLIILRLLKARISRHQVMAFWVFYLFFPISFTQLSTLGSDMPFLLILLVTCYTFFQQKRICTFRCLMALTALCLTRPLGLIFAGTLVMWNFFRADYRRVLIASFALIGAVSMNHIIESISLDENCGNRYMSRSPALVFYYANSTKGDGNTDYLKQPAIASQDTNLVKYSEGKISGRELIEEALVQNIRAPMIFLRNNYFKTINYFFNYWPSSWILHGGVQSVFKKITQLSFNLLIIAVLFYSIVRFKSKDNYFYVVFFVFSYVYHMLFLSRYRYFVPVLYLGFPSIVSLFIYMTDKASSLFPDSALCQDVHEKRNRRAIEEHSRKRVMTYFSSIR
jgi:hypothetical protein